MDKLSHLQHITIDSWIRISESPSVIIGNVNSKLKIDRKIVKFKLPELKKGRRFKLSSLSH